MTNSEFRKRAMKSIPLYKANKYAPKPEVKLKEEGRMDLKFALEFYKKLKDKEKRNPGCYFPLMELIASLYVLEMIIANCKNAFDPKIRYLKTRQDEIINQLDRFFISYTLVAVSGELRYGIENTGRSNNEWGEIRPKIEVGLGWRQVDSSNSTSFTENDLLDIFKRLSKLGVNYINSDNVKEGRKSIHAETLNIKQENYSEILGWFRMLLAQFSWPSTCGGKPWFDILETVITRLKGKYSPMVFVDRCLDLEHNNGCYLDKTNLINTSESPTLKSLLDEKRDARSVKELLRCVLLSQAKIRNSAIENNFKGVMKEKLLSLLQYRNLTTESKPIYCQKCNTSRWGWAAIVCHAVKKKHYKWAKHG